MDLYNPNSQRSPCCFIFLNNGCTSASSEKRKPARRGRVHMCRDPRHTGPARPACSLFRCALSSTLHRSTPPPPRHIFLFSEVNWNWGKCYLSISDWCFICYHEKNYFWRLRSFIYLWTLFSSLLLTLWISFFHFINFFKTFCFVLEYNWLKIPC